MLKSHAQSPECGPPILPASRFVIYTRRTGHRYSFVHRVMAVSRPPSPAVLGRAEPGIAVGPAMASLDDRTNTVTAQRLQRITEDYRHTSSASVLVLRKSAFDLMTDFDILRSRLRIYDKLFSLYRRLQKSSAIPSSLVPDPVSLLSLSVVKTGDGTLRLRSGQASAVPYRRNDRFGPFLYQEATAA